MNWHQWGIITLNIDLTIYALMYTPQLWHNLGRQSLRQMSFGFHAMMFYAISIDLYYAVGLIRMWQFLAVDMIFWLCLFIQHIQRLRMISDRKQRRQHHILLALVLITSAGALLQQQHPWSPSTYNALGWIANIGFWCAGIPQIIKNRRDNEAIALNRAYLGLELLVCTLDGVCAWALHWGSATRYGFIFPVIIKCLIIYQSYTYRTRSSMIPEAA